MRVLLDECLDQRLRFELAGHDVHTVPEMGWAGTPNGQLLALAEEQFEAFVTLDLNLPYQQQLAKYRLAVFLLRAPTSKLSDLQPLMAYLRSQLDAAQPGQVRVIGPGSS